VYTAAQAPPAVVWVTMWDSERDAEEAARCAERVRTSSAARKRGEIVRHGRSVLILRDLPDAARASVRRAFSDGKLGTTSAP
jgi:hypothetical protein